MSRDKWQATPQPGNWRAPRSAGEGTAASASPTEGRVSINGIALRYLDWGTRGKTPMVCLHGHTGQARIWDEFAAAASPQHRVLALDQRGHGESQWAKDGYDRWRFVEDLAAFMDALKLEKAVLCGASMGGWNSLLYALQNPGRVERIILVDIGPEASEASRGAPSRPPTPMEFATLDGAFAWTRQWNPWASDSRLRRDLRDRLRRHHQGRWTWKADPALFNTPLRDGQDPDLVARYWQAVAEAPCPILLVRGMESTLLSDDIVARMQSANPRLQVAEVQGAGHVVPVDRPREFIEATRSFLAL